MRIGIIGCGLIGERRGQQICSPHTVSGVYDPVQSRAEHLGNKFNAKVYSSSKDVCLNSDIVIIAVPNCFLARLTIEALECGVHVLVEKPGAIKLSEIQQMKSLASKKNLMVKLGFNHRFHPAILEAKYRVDNGEIGELMFARGRYGHGGRVGYNKEWRFDASVAGGGELMDQGVHFLDLIYWFFGPLPLQSSLVHTSFWDTQVDDNAVLTLATKKQWATFHVSCSEWKNTFSLEIYGQKGKLWISGLGKSYGVETLTVYKMKPEMGPPETEVIEFKDEDRSWEKDLDNLVQAIEAGTPLLGSLDSAEYALKQVLNAYKENHFEVPGLAE